MHDVEGIIRLLLALWPQPGSKIPLSGRSLRGGWAGEEVLLTGWSARFDGVRFARKVTGHFAEEAWQVASGDPRHARIKGVYVSGPVESTKRFEMLRGAVLLSSRMVYVDLVYKRSQ
jgi:hypothetical protein